MNADEQTRIFKEFLEKFYYPPLLETVRKGENFLRIDFMELAKFSPEIVEELLEHPEEIIKAGENAVKEFDLSHSINRFYLRFFNLPESQKIRLSEIRSKHLGKFFWTEGAVRTKSEVRPHVMEAKFECPSCGSIISKLQDSKSYTEPSRCACGRKGKFKEVSKELVDGQGLTLEESSEDLEGGEQPKRLHVFLKNDLVSPLNERRASPGTKVRVVGWVGEVPITLRTGGQSTKFDLLIEANNVDTVDEDFYMVKVTEEEEKAIKELAEDPHAYERLINSLAPSIYGHEKVKEALVLQLAGGVKKERPDGVTIRGDSHILLIGDPGSGKSQILKRIGKIAPKGRYTSGKGVSAAGLTASVVKDELLGGWSLEAGALVLSNKGFCAIDEMDKMAREDTAALHEAMEQQTISISKANIQATLHAETTILAAANPKSGRFNPYDPPAQQLDPIAMPSTLLSRFDLIFPIKDLPDKIKDEKMASHILGMHQNPGEGKPELETKFLRKFFSYIRQHCKPQLTDGALKEIKDYYVQMRSMVQADGGGIRAIPITARQLEALTRLAEASAKLRLSSKVTKKDAQRAIDMIDYCLKEVAMDKETGVIDIDRISTDVSSSQRNKMMTVKELLVKIEEEMGGNKQIEKEKLVAACVEKGIKSDELEKILELMHRSGEVFEPRRGVIQRL